MFEFGCYMDVIITNYHCNCCTEQSISETFIWHIKQINNGQLINILFVFTINIKKKQGYIDKLSKI